jgi:hypothetical protein
MTDLDIIDEYIVKRRNELNEMLNVYDAAEQKYPIDLLARLSELNRLYRKLDEYKDVMEYGKDENKTANA